MKLVVGLGNPGVKYAFTRHNVGFWAVDCLGENLGVQVNREKWQSCYAEVQVGSEKTILLKPQTFMNRSGDAVRAVLNSYHQLDVQKDLIVLYDDMDFSPGQMKLRAQGSAGGHNGMKSVIAHVGTTEFARIRIGIGRPKPGEVMQYVLSPFLKEEELLVRDAVQRSADAVKDSITQTFSYAMNQYNR